MNANFYGEYLHTIDEKGRVKIPRKLKEDLGPLIYVTKGLDKCLFVYSPEGWEKLNESINKLPTTSKDSRDFSRFFYAGANVNEIDKQSRILISQSLREYAGLEKEVYVVGVGTRVEIWNKKNWEKYNSEQNDIEAIAENMQTNNLII